MKKIQTSVLILIPLLLITSLVYAADQGKIAVASEGMAVTAEVSGVAGRSPYFLIFEGDGKFVEGVDNPYKATGRGAGPSVASFLAQKGVTFIVAGEFGKKMSPAMKAKGVGYLEFRGSAEEAVKKVLEERGKND
jgi:predicted Fe-Mo cluster-binding NifX family protein